MFDAPNLDGLYPEELDELGRVLERLARYARLKAVAMRQRSYGHVDRALEIEGALEQLYLGLPDWAKW